MESLIHAFGIDARLIAIQILNFAVLAVALSYFLYKPILRIVKEREEKIKAGIRDAEAAAASLQEAENQKNEVLSGAHKEAESVMARAKESAKSEAADIVKEAEKAAANKIRLGEERGAVLAEEARRESEAEIARLDVLAAAEVLQEKAK
jgi:F-type H+-transporting ATPase subunit b